MARQPTQADEVRVYIDMLYEEKRRMNECLENIAEISVKLQRAVTAAQMRLMIEKS